LWFDASEKNPKKHTPWKFNIAPENMMVGRLLCFWDGNFPGGKLLNFGVYSPQIAREACPGWCVDTQNTSLLNQSKSTKKNRPKNWIDSFSFIKTSQQSNYLVVSTPFEKC